MKLGSGSYHSNMESLVLLMMLLIGTKCILAYKPVFLIHGILADKTCMEVIKQRIEELHPGTIVYNTERFDGFLSLENMWHQVEQLMVDIENVTEQHPDGIHLVGFSQGALLARSILQSYPEHKVRNFISLSGPQAGQFGVQFLNLIFPHVALKDAYELFYTNFGQETSVGNYWNDPYHRSSYLNSSKYLPYINNELKSNKSIQYKEAITKLEKMVLIGGPDDGIITPWESSQFGFYDDNMTVINLVERDFYQDDLIGLRTLDETGRLDIITVPGVDHEMWHHNITIIDTYILPYLD